MGGQNQAAVIFGASIYISLGLLALAQTSLISGATSLSTSQFLQLWGLTITAMIVGFLMLVAGILVGSGTQFRRLIGGGLGAVSSLVGAITVPALINTIIGVGSTTTISPFGGGSAQLSTMLLVLLVCAIAALLVGFPLGMVGSFRSFKEPETGQPETSEQL